MMTKRRRFSVSVLLLLLAISLSFPACRKSEAPSEETGTSAQTVGELEKVGGKEANETAAGTENEAKSTAVIKAEPDSEKEEETEKTEETEPTVKTEAGKSGNSTEEPLGKTETTDPSKFADEKNAVVMSSASGKLGDTVSHSVTVCGDVDFCAVSFDVHYDSSRLKFVSFDSEHDLVTNFDTTGGVLHMNYVKASNVKEALTLCRLSFEVLTDEACDTDVSVKVKEIVGVDGADISDREYTTHNGVCHLNGKDGV